MKQCPLAASARPHCIIRNRNSCHEQVGCSDGQSAAGPAKPNNCRLFFKYLLN